MGVEKCNCETYTDYLCEFACASKVCPGAESENCPVVIAEREVSRTKADPKRTTGWEIL